MEQPPTEPNPDGTHAIARGTHADGPGDSDGDGDGDGDDDDVPP